MVSALPDNLLHLCHFVLIGLKVLSYKVRLVSEVLVVVRSKDFGGGWVFIRDSSGEGRRAPCYKRTI